MSEKPIGFNNKMVRDVLSGSKTQTRRVITTLKGFGKISNMEYSNVPGYCCDFRDKQKRWNSLTRGELLARCPYGSKNDKLWVREAWRIGALSSHSEFAIDYRADNHCRLEWLKCPDPTMFARLEKQSIFDVHKSGLKPDADGKVRWKPSESPCRWRRSIFMPRLAFRIQLRVLNVRVERVQEITEVDAMGEGVKLSGNVLNKFQDLWNSINEKRGFGWNANPLVWVVEFERINGDRD